MMRHFEEELKELKEKLLFMGSLVEKMIDKSVECLVERKEELTKLVYNSEEIVNKAQLEIDNKCLRLIALYQPTANDLRFITSTMKINSDLERMGDQAVNMAQNCIFFLKTKPLRQLKDIPKMSETVKKMVKNSLDAFVEGDANLAKNVLLKDDEVDALKNKIFKELLTSMLSDADKIKRSLDLILISRNLERIGDHATNIAEDVIFMVLGQDIRHHSQDGIK